MLHLLSWKLNNSWSIVSISAMEKHGVCKFCGNMLCVLSRMLNNSWNLVTVHFIKIHASMLLGEMNNSWSMVSVSNIETMFHL